MKVLAILPIIALTLGLSACGHFRSKGCCGKSECKMEQKECCKKESKDCKDGECEMKK